MVSSPLRRHYALIPICHWPYHLEVSSCLLHLAHNLARARQRLDHLLAFLPPTDGEVAFLEEVLEFVGAVRVLEEFTLHFVFGVSEN